MYRGKKEKATGAGGGEPWTGNYFGGELIGRAEVEMRVGKLKSGRPQVKMRSLEK